MALQYPQVEQASANGNLLFIWGGSSALGSCAIQMGKAAGYEIATTCSGRNFDYCRHLGAQHVFDYTKEDVIEEVGKKLQGKNSAGVFRPIIAEGVMDKSAQIADRLGGSRVVSVVYPPAVPVPDPIPDGVKILQSKCHIRKATTPALTSHHRRAFSSRQHSREGNIQFVAASRPCKW